MAHPAADQDVSALPGLGGQGGPAAGEDLGSERDLAVVLDDYMAAHGLTLQQMADRSGLAIATIAALRAGTRGKRPHPTTVAKLAAAMQIDPSQLDTAIAVGGGSARMREAKLLAGFRGLEEDGKAELEGLLVRLVSRRRSGESGSGLVPAAG